MKKERRRNQSLVPLTLIPAPLGRGGKANSRVAARLGLLLLVLVGMVLDLSPSPAVAQEAGGLLTVRYFDELRQRRLFSVAEQLGMDRLADPLTTPGEFITFSVELSKTYAEHARYTSGDEHDQYWQFADEVLAEALAKHGRHPRSLLLKVQQAFLPALRGEFLRTQVELYPFDEALRRQADEVFTTAIDRLKPLEADLARRHRQNALHRQRGEKGLATFELHDLHSETRFRLAVTLQEFAQMKSGRLGEEAALLREAFVWFNTLSESPPGDPFKRPAKIRLAENLRLRSDLAGADAVLKELEEISPSGDLQGQIEAERIRWLVAKGRLAEALNRLVEFRKTPGQDTGELAFLTVEILLSQWESAERSSQTSQARRLAQAIEKEAKALQSRFGGYWGVRASLAAEGLQQAQKYGIQVAGIVRRAEAQYAAGNPASAAETYHLASEGALKAGKPDVAFDLGYTEASILLQLKKYPEAADAFEQLRNRFPENQRAANAHLLEGYCLGKLYETNPSDPRREAYTQHLKKHVETYPQHETAGEAYWMLGTLEEQRLQNTLALTYYRNIPAGHRLGLKAQLAVARCYEKVINRLHELAETADKTQLEAIRERTLEWEQAGTEELARFIKTYPEEPKPFTSAQADVALQLARLELMRTKPEYARADGLLERILASGAEPAADEWQRILKTSRQLRIVSLAGQGLSRQAEQLVEELSQSSTRDVLGVMDGLMLIAKKSDAVTRRSLGQLQLQTAVELNSRRAELDEAEQSRLDHCRAQAYLATNRPDEALKIYNQMLSQDPKNAGLYREVAELLSDTSDRAGLLRAKELWRTLEAREKPGSVSWLEKRYQVARCTWKLGQTEECRKLIGVTKLLYPQLGNAALRSKYAELEKELAGNG